MDEVGLFPPERRFELLGGEIVEMAPIGIRHAATVDWLTQTFFDALNRRAIVRVQNPVRISDLSELQPDVTLLRWREDFYRNAHPTPDDVVLMIEVSDTTAAWDRRRKRPLYAAAGVAELWIIDVSQNVIDVATDPGPGTEGYRCIRQVLPGGTLTPLALPDLTIAAADLLA